MLDKNLGLIVMIVCLAHFCYMFLAHKKSILQVIDVIGILFGSALYQYPEKVNEIISTVMGTAK
ncbi:MAG: hypothetical protein WC889_07220 [Myxococcota bacterium]|jgi:hypothetical protein